MTDEMPVRLPYVGPEHVVGQLVEPAAPDHVIHSAMESELVSFSLHRLQQRHEGKSHGTGKGGLEDEAGPAGFLDQVNRIAVGQLGLGPCGALPDPFDQVGGAAHVHEERVGHSEIAAGGLNSGKSVGSTYPVVD